MSGATTHPREADIDIGRLFGAIWRDKFKIAIAALIVTALSYVLLSLVSPTFMSNARVLIESSESVFTRPSPEQLRDDPILDEQGVASQVQILTSSDLLMDVAKDLDLASRDEFDELRSLSMAKGLLITLGLMADPGQMSQDRRVLANVRERLEVYPIENSRVIVIEFESEDKELAADFPNALANAYLELESRAALDSTGRAASYLADEIEDLKLSVRQAEARVAEYRAANGLFDGQNNETLSTQQLSELSSELSRVRASRADAEARARSVEQALSSGTAIDTLPDVISSPIVTRLREQEINLNADLAELSTTLLDNHPRIKSLRSQLDDLSSKVRGEARKVLEGLRNEAAIAREREQQLSRDLNTLKAATATTNEQEVELRALERQAASERALLESYLIRFREAQSRGEGEYAPARARLISRATVSNVPSFPKMIPLLGAIFFATLLLGMLTSLLGELFSGRALVPASAAGAAPSPVTAQPPRTAASAASQKDKAPAPAPARMKAAVGEKPASDKVAPVRVAPATTARQTHADASDERKFTVHGLALKLVERGASRAIVVSPEGDESALGSVQLARLLAENGLRIILLDLSGSGAASAHMVDRQSVGITELLCAQSSYSEVIHPDDASSAHVIPTGTASPDQASRGIARLPMILNAMASAYDMVVVECGATDANGLKRLVDADSEIVMAIADPNAAEVRAAARNLTDGGFQDISILQAPLGENPVPPRDDERELALAD